MAQNFKPIIDELKQKITQANTDEMREKLFDNLKQTKDTVEKTIKQVAQQTKDSRLMHEYIIPFVESEKADQAMKFLNTKLGSVPLVTKIEHARKTIIDLKTDQAKHVDPVPVEEHETAQASTVTEIKPKKKAPKKEKAETHEE